MKKIKLSDLEQFLEGVLNLSVGKEVKFVVKNDCLQLYINNILAIYKIKGDKMDINLSFAALYPNFFKYFA